MVYGQKEKEGRKGGEGKGEKRVERRDGGKQEYDEKKKKRKTRGKGKRQQAEGEGEKRGENTKEETSIGMITES